jgi:hypothetical protein
MLGLELNMTHYGEHFAFALFLRENPLVIGQINDDTTLHKEENDNRVA